MLYTLASFLCKSRFTDIVDVAVNRPRGDVHLLGNLVDGHAHVPCEYLHQPQQLHYLGLFHTLCLLQIFNRFLLITGVVNFAPRALVDISAHVDDDFTHEGQALLRFQKLFLEASAFAEGYDGVFADYGGVYKL